MDKQLLDIINHKAKRLNIGVHPDFGRSMDDYFIKTDGLNLSDAQKRIVSTYLSVKALNIAKVEKKAILDPSDVKAAMWNFHEPKDLHDTECKNAAEFILSQHTHGQLENSLPEEFKEYLRTYLEGGAAHA